MKVLGILLLLIIVAIAFGTGTSSPPQPPAAPPSPEEAARKAAEEDRKAAEEAEFQTDVVTVRRVRAAMKNPDSFKLERALRMADGTLCLSYRATNSFNAIIPGHAVATKREILITGHDGLQARWNARCAKKSGTDVTYIRQAL